MYLVRIETAGGVFRQGVARMRWPRAGGSDARRFETWRRRCVRVCAALPTQSAFASIELGVEGALSSLYAFLVKDENADLARSAIAALVRVEGYGDAEVDLPTGPDDFVESFAAPGPGHDRLTLTSPDAAAPGGVPLWAPTRLFTALPDIVATALRLGSPIVYETATTDLRPGTEILREELIGLSRLEDLAGAPEDLIDMRRRAVARLRAGQRHGVEALIAPPDAARMIEGLLRADPDWAIASRHGFEPTLAPMDEDTTAALGFLTHPAAMGVEEAALDRAGFMSEDDHVARLTLAGLVEAAPEGEAKTPPASPPAAAAANGAGGPDGPFLFLSYAHCDWPKLETMIAALRGKGVRIWIDEQIHGGEDWDTRLERQIMDCEGVLAMVSGHYVGSKVCRRELKFADVLDKPLIAVRLDEAALGEGLALLFASLQYIEGRCAEVEGRLLTAIAEKAARARGPVGRG